MSASKVLTKAEEEEVMNRLKAKARKNGITFCHFDNGTVVVVSRQGLLDLLDLFDKEAVQGTLALFMEVKEKEDFPFSPPIARA